MFYVLLDLLQGKNSNLQSVRQGLENIAQNVQINRVRTAGENRIQTIKHLSI